VSESLNNQADINNQSVGDEYDTPALIPRQVISERRRSFWLTRLLVALFNVYGFILTLLLILRFLLGERPWIQGYSPIGLLNSLIPLMLLPAPIFLLLLLLMRRRLSALLQLLPAGMVIAGYIGLFLAQQTPEPAPDEPRFSVLSYNVYASNRRYDAIIDQIRTANADVVVLQELSEPIAERLEAEFEADYTFIVFSPEGETVQGAGIMSRLELRDIALTQIVFNQQRVIVNVDGHDIALMNIHLPVPYLYGLNTDRRSQALTQILQLATQQPRPLLMVGDFNMSDGSEDYQRVVQNNAFGDAFRSVGFGFGFSYPDLGLAQPPLSLLPPLARLDYQFYSDGLRPVRAWTADRSTGSDHRAVYVEYQLTGEPVR
jgi:endonuclease/exonuclease/phosphatase (EEP) superfamily protein YafD